MFQISETNGCFISKIPCGWHQGKIIITHSNWLNINIRDTVHIYSWRQGITERMEIETEWITEQNKQVYVSGGGQYQRKRGEGKLSEVLCCLVDRYIYSILSLSQMTTSVTSGMSTTEIQHCQTWHLLDWSTIPEQKHSSCEVHVTVEPRLAYSWLELELEYLISFVNISWWFFQKAITSTLLLSNALILMYRKKLIL